jgi:16S rRNA (uracil1498-N3)-methyltransferase
MRVGQEARLFNGCGMEARAELVSESGRDALFRCMELVQTPALACRVSLAQAVPKGKSMEWIIEKATELGVYSIIPLLTTHTVVQCDEREALKKQEKWQRVALEASKQCGQNWLPVVEKPCSLRACLQGWGSAEVKWVGSLEKDGVPLRQIVGGWATVPESALLLVGPEGDFSPAELADARASGCAPVSFGPLTLRSETAAIFGLSVLAYAMH